MKPRILKPETKRGQSLVLIALMLFGLVSFVGLALDGGQVYVMRRQMQNAADAAALAGVDEVAEGLNTQVYYRINQYAIGDSTVGNRATDFHAWYYNSDHSYYSDQVPVQPNVPPPLGTDCVRVQTHKTFQTLVISFLGFNTLDAVAVAAGCFGQIVHPTTALWPMTIYTQSFQLNTTYNLFGGAQNAPGQFGWLSYDGSNAASQLWPKLESGYGGPFQVYNASPCDGGGQTNVQSLGLPTCIKGAPGVKASDQGPAATRLDDIVVIPIFDNVSGNGSNTYYHIVGFAAFHVTGVCIQNPPGDGDCSGLSPSAKVIRGEFVNYVTTGQFCTSNCGPNYGLKTIKLSQ